MKTLFLIRHAKSSWSDAGMRDFDRPLNARGFRDAPFMAKLLAGKAGHLDRIVSSPANRAFTTSTFFAEAFDIPIANIQKEERIYEASSGTVLDLIQSFDNSWNQVALFGHNPAFTNVANMFSNEYISNMPTCCIAQITAIDANWSEFNGDTASLRALYFPKQYFDS